MAKFKDTDKTVFVERKEGAIIGVYANCQAVFAEEEMLADDPEVVAFIDAQKDI